MGLLQQLSNRRKPVQVMSVGAVCRRALFLESNEISAVTDRAYN
jgi:hypothetical protein